jgi:hypothetical protein
MSTFSQLETQKPPAFVLVPPDAFASAWDGRPAEEVCIGLRFVPDSDLEDARVEALKRAERLVPDHRKSDEATEVFVASFQDTLVRWIIARGTCDPNDVTKPWEPWEAAPEDICVEQALTDQGAHLIFDAWERMRIGANIGQVPATDGDLALLPELLGRLPAVGAKSKTAELRLRRLLRFVLEQLQDIDGT